MVTTQPLCIHAGQPQQCCGSARGCPECWCQCCSCELHTRHPPRSGSGLFIAQTWCFTANSLFPPHASHHLSPAGPVAVKACSDIMRREKQPGHEEPQAHSLFAYPLESNFSGVRYDPEHIRRVQQHGVQVRTADGRSPGDASCKEAACGDGREHWAVMLDAAKACCSAPPDLSLSPADFVVRFLMCQDSCTPFPYHSPPLSDMQTVSIDGPLTSDAGAVFLQNLWVSKWPGRAAGPQRLAADPPKRLLWWRRRQCISRRCRFLPVSGEESAMAEVS